MNQSSSPVCVGGELLLCEDGRQYRHLAACVRRHRAPRIMHSLVSSSGHAAFRHTSKVEIISQQRSMRFCTAAHDQGRNFDGDKSTAAPNPSAGQLSFCCAAGLAICYMDWSREPSAFAGRTRTSEGSQIWSAEFDNAQSQRVYRVAA